MELEYSHRVSKYTEETLRNLVKEKAHQDCAAYEEYLKNNALVNFKKRLRFPTYESMKGLLDALGVSYRDFFTRVNLFPEIRVDWATPTQSNMANILDMMNEQQKSKVLETVHAQLSDQVRVALEENAENPVFGLRITNVLEKSSNEDNNMLRIYTQLGIPEKWRHNKRDDIKYVSAPHEYLPALTHMTGISLHWALGWGVPILAQTESTEVVMDEFCFLPQRTQEIIEQSISNAIRTGGILLGR